MARTNKNISSEYYLILEGPYSIQNAIKLKNQIVKSLKKYNDLFLVHNGNNEADLSYIQILLSVINSAKARNKKVRLQYTERNPFINLLNNAGISELLTYTEPNEAGENNVG